MAVGGEKMADIVREPQARAGDTEKITINLGYVCLSHIDLMVHEGFTRIASTTSPPQSATSSNDTPTS
jgi:hypothetical protein